MVDYTHSIFLPNLKTLHTGYCMNWFKKKAHRWYYTSSFQYVYLSLWRLRSVSKTGKLLEKVIKYVMLQFFKGKMIVIKFSTNCGSTMHLLLLFIYEAWTNTILRCAFAISGELYYFYLPQVRLFLMKWFTKITFDLMPSRCNFQDRSCVGESHIWATTWRVLEKETWGRRSSSKREWSQQLWLNAF